MPAVPLPVTTLPTSGNTADGNIVSGQGTPNPVIDQGGNYILTVINNETGCMNGTNVMVSEDIENPILTIAPPGLISCTEPELVLDANGSSTGPEFDYSWTTQDGIIVNGADGPTPTISSGGTYILTILNQDTNCSTVDSVSVPENADLPAVGIDPVNSLNCTLSEIELTGTIGGGNNLSFTWSTADGNFTSGTNSLNPLVDAPGTYILEVLNDDTGCSNSTAITVDENVAVPLSDAGPDSLLNCVVTELSLNGTNSAAGPEIVYQWTTADGNITTGANSATPTVNAPGTYILEVVNIQNTCVDADTVVVTDDVVIPVPAIKSACFDGLYHPDRDDRLQALLQVDLV